MKDTTRTAIEHSLASILNRHIKYYKKLYSTFKNHRNIEAYIKAIEYRYILILETSALLESLINLYLAIKVKGKKFNELEFKPFKEKWVKIPRQFNPSYKVDDHTVELLELLIKYRKSIAHNRPFLQAEGNIVHKGNFPDKIENEHQKILELTRLPILLLEQLTSFDDALAIENYTIKKILKNSF